MGDDLELKFKKAVSSFLNKCDESKRKSLFIVVVQIKVFLIKNGPPTESSNEVKLNYYKFFKQVCYFLKNDLYSRIERSIYMICFYRQPWVMCKDHNHGQCKWSLVQNGMHGTQSKVKMNANKTWVLFY